MQFFKNLFSKPHSTTLLTVTSSSGFHLRPVAVFVSKAKSFDCTIQASFQNKTVDAKTVNTLLSLNLDINDTFTLHAKGPLAKEALELLTQTFNTLMHNDQKVGNISKESHTYEGNYLEGISIKEGIAIAPLHTYTQKAYYEEKKINFQEAINAALEELEKLFNTQKTNENATIYLAQKELLSSLSTQSKTLDEFEKHIHVEIETLKGGKLESKSIDYLDILQRVKYHLGYRFKISLPIEKSILIADDLLPSEIPLLEKSHVTGVILKKTSPTSHTAILLRAAGITSLILNDEIPLEINNSIILDANSAVVVITPSTLDIQKAQEQQAQYQNKIKNTYEKRFQKSYTKTNKLISVYANISDLASAQQAKDEGAEGIGLFRTEFLFKEKKPSFQMQVDAYSKIFDIFPNTTIRTLDIGGDKALPYVTLPKESNPFLGIRGIRLFKSHPELMQEQLLAILTAAKNRAIKIMFPMISCVTEFIEVKKLAQHIAKKNHINIDNIQFGIMIEVPSTLFLIESFNKEVDFYSIGTNDLTQYLFAIDRIHSTLTIDPLSSVIFDTIALIMNKAKKTVSICGELANHKEAIPKLLALNIETLSVSPKSIAQTKEEIRNV